ncbi:MULTISPECIES: 2OG-Fe(II) oxygenase [Pseudomonas]|uniref:2OG-Fe(II) oxygenase n=1 Tax=Pseudomonas cedrina TaxID=651740 RepID=A0A2S9E809_PSECE|nr:MULTISPECIES: 2OG-Fe(II) oxygenase [Pseudomonas]AVJ23472.1 2OG-Fe(II) oxygenase [Pseudomonas sp. MYb193]PRC10986.1 2OG-Fe(II) oxygenase [Pseudomonas cedrina]
MNEVTEATITDIYSQYAEELQSTGSTLIPAGIVFSGEEITRLAGLQAQIPEETVTNGDAGDKHAIYVRRIMVDRAGELPSTVNRPFSDGIIDILSGGQRPECLAALFQSQDPFHIRRCQMNRMIAGSFVGVHLDAASNPDYDYSMIVQLGRNFEGGAFVVHTDNGQQRSYMASYGSVLVTTCKYRHEVSKVLSGERNSLVYFYSKHAGANRRSQ